MEVKKVAAIVVGLVILMSLAAALFPEFQSAADDVNTSMANYNSTGGYVSDSAMGGIFGGVLLALVFGAAVLYAVLKGFGVM